MDSPLSPSSFVPSFPPLAAFGGAPLYLTGEDALKLTVQNAAAGVTVTLTGRMLPFGSTRAVPFKQTLVPATDRTVSSVILGLGDGWLLTAQAIVSGGTPVVGQCFARLSIVHGLSSVADELCSLAADYITAKQPLSYPGSGILRSVDGGGALRSITGATPGAGAEISETVPTGARWELLSLKATLTTSGTVATRVMQLSLDDGTSEFARVATTGSQPASNAAAHSFVAGSFLSEVGGANAFLQGLPFRLGLAAGFRIRTSTVNIQVGDQYSAIQYLVREWIEGA